MEVRKKEKGFLSALFSKPVNKRTEYEKVSLSHVYVLHTYLRNVAAINFPDHQHKLCDLVLLIKNYMEQYGLTTLSLYKTLEKLNILEIEKDKNLFYNAKKDLVFHLLAIDMIKR